MSQQQTQRAILLVLDSVGVGAMPDASDYNDPPNCFTFGHVAEHCQGLHLPNMAQMGLGHIAEIEGVERVEHPSAAFGKMAELAPGKDTTTGHWEMAGAILEKALALFPNGFSDELIQAFSERTGRPVLGNCSASGTEIIQRLGAEQAEKGAWIVYTSADSVFQIAAHEEIIPLEELYRACEIARDLVAPLQVGRVIARPYIGEPGAYVRTPNRHDYALNPPSETILDRLTTAGIPVTGVGKIADVFNHRGVPRSVKSKTNTEGMEKTFALLKEETPGLIFINLVDFDSKFGHRNDPKGYGEALEMFDRQLETLLSLLKPDDLFMITADHGCDPTVPGTNHSREYVPLLVKHASLLGGTSLGIRGSFSDIAQSLASFWKFPPMPVGESFLPSSS